MVSETARSLGIAVISMGDIIREEADARRIVKTPSSLGNLMLQLRKEKGEHVVAKRCLEKIMNHPGIVLIEGIRSIDEVNFFKENSKVCLIAVHASPKTRFDRLIKRDRPDDPKEWKTFYERDMRELGVGLGVVIALADKLFINEGTVAEISDTVKSFFEGIIDGSKSDC
ncbi:MAG: AAA family ATPase [Candidatus Methanomethylicus sp.]|nr:AAA family ATPase [Candidatus Methanomethylicus sp.]